MDVGKRGEHQPEMLRRLKREKFPERRIRITKGEKRTKVQSGEEAKPRMGHGIGGKRGVCIVSQVM